MRVFGKVVHLKNPILIWNESVEVGKKIVKILMFIESSKAVGKILKKLET